MLQVVAQYESATIEGRRWWSGGKGEGKSSQLVRPRLLLSLLSPDLAVSRRSRVKCSPGRIAGRAWARAISAENNQNQS